MRRPLTAAVLLLLAPLAMGQAYKWTDASGTVHYSDNPPPKGVQAKRITTSGSVQPLAEPAKPASANSSSEAASSQQQAQQPMADTPENRKKLCGTLKSNLDILRDKRPVVVQEGKEQKVLDDTQRKQQQTTAEAQYKQYCPND